MVNRINASTKSTNQGVRFACQGTAEEPELPTAARVLARTPIH